jgi:hypothetical protein
MEKLSRSTDKIPLGNINFSGFSQSKGWVGFFETNKGYSPQIVDEALRIFHEFFSSHWDGFFALSSLVYDDQNETDESIISLYGEKYEKAKKEGYLNPVSDAFESYLYGDVSLPAAEVTVHFDRNDFIDICKLLMMHSGVIGEVFFMINPELGVAVYPHQDLGFGIICFGDNYLLCQRFLKSADNGNFRVVID